MTLSLFPRRRVVALAAAAIALAVPTALPAALAAPSSPSRVSTPPAQGPGPSAWTQLQPAKAGRAPASAASATTSAAPAPSEAMRRRPPVTARPVESPAVLPAADGSSPAPSSSAPAVASAAVASAAVASAAVASAADASGSGSMAGTVTDAAGTHHALAGVTVKVFSQAASVQRTGTTAGDGTWTITGLPAASDYQACFVGWNATGGSSDALGYQFACYRGQQIGTLTVRDGASTSGVDAALSAGGVVTGTVSSPSTAGLAGVRVSVSDYSLQGVSGTPSATTDAQGRYRVTGLATDTSYQVCFDAAGAAGGGRTGMAGQCWDRQPPGAGTPLSVSAGATRDGIDASLRRGGAVSGTVRDSVSGRPLKGAGVAVVLGGVVAQGVTRADGTYRIDGVPAGTGYLVEVLPTDATGGSSDASGYQSTFLGSDVPDQATRVTVTASATTSGLDVDVVPAGALTGVVTDRATPPSGLHGVLVRVRSDQAFYYGLTRVETGADGRYRIKGLRPATDYVVCFDTSEGGGWGGSSDDTGYQSQCWNGVRPDRSPTPVTVRAGSITPVRAALAAGGAISGRVLEAGTRAPLGGVRVDIGSAKGPIGASDGAVTDRDGRYTVRGLTPAGAPYSVCFSPSATSYGGAHDALGYAGGCWRDQPAGGSSATRVGVQAGETATGVSAVLHPAGAVEGIVTDRTSGRPLAGVSAVVTGAAGRVYQYATTGPDGRFRVTALDPAADYTVCYLTNGPGTVTGGADDSRGYAPACYRNQPTPSTATRITVTAARTTAASQALKAAGAVAGTVTQLGSGAPLAGVSVTVQSVSLGSYAFATTDSTGHYQVGGLAPASDYTVCFDGRSATGGSSDGGGYESVCYDGAPDQGSATPVTIATGRTRTIDVTLAGATGVAGTVTEDGAGQHALAGVPVSAFSSSTGAFGSAITDQSGRYTISGLSPATDYAVCFQPQYGFVTGGSQDDAGYVGECFDDRSPDQPSTPVTVTAGSVTTADAGLADGGAVTGRVTDTAGDPLSGVSVLTGPAGGSSTYATSTSPDGTYTVRGLPASTDLTVCFSGAFATGGSAASYGDGCWQDTQPPPDGTPTPVTITVGSTTAGIDAVLPPTG